MTNLDNGWGRADAELAMPCGPHGDCPQESFALAALVDEESDKTGAASLRVLDGGGEVVGD